MIVTLAATLVGCHASRRATNEAPVPATLPNAPMTLEGVRAAERRRVPLPDAWTLSAAHNTASHRTRWSASNSALASQAGVEILREGGNAVDAAVAVGFALAVTLPEAGNIGGGGFMVIRMADGRSFALDYREMAPLRGDAQHVPRRAGTRHGRSQVGHLASGVPGSVAGMTAALERYGTMPLAKVMAPAIRLADSGFMVDSALARSIEGTPARIAPYEGAAVFLPGGHPLAVGHDVQAARARARRSGRSRRTAHRHSTPVRSPTHSPPR